MFAELIVKLFNLISPRQCAMCGCRLAIGEDVICSACNLDLPRTHYSKKPYDNEMARMFWGRMPVERAAAMFFYRAHSAPSRIIYSMKYFNHPEVGELIGRAFAEEIKADGFFNDIDAILPIPLAKNRKRERGYNQSMEIARGISEMTGLPIIRNVIKRKPFKRSQTQLNRWQRNENVADQFTMKSGKSINARHILIVDDVVTTGATVISCANELMKGGAERFSVLSLGFSKQ